MELRQLAYFVAVADEASFTRAAARAHVAQPGVSAQIRRLEREFGQDLLHRGGRGVRLTEVGAAVLPYARAALAAAAGARLVVDEFAGLVRGRVAVGMVVACASVDLAEVVATFHRRHPAVDVTLAEAGSDRLLAAVRGGDLDLAFAGLAGARPEGVALQVVADEPLVAAVAPGDPLAGRRGVPLEALRDRPLICLPPGTGVRGCLDEACAAAGWRPRVACEASDLHMVARLAGRGLGVGVLPESVARAHAAEVAAVPVTEPPLRGRLALAWRAGGPSSPAALALIAHARAMLPVAAPGADSGGRG